MDENPSLQKPNEQSFSTLNSDDFVLVPLNQEDKPQLKIMANGDDQLEKAMEEILRDSEKAQNNLPESDTIVDLSTFPSPSVFLESITKKPPMTLILDPSNTEVPVRRSSDTSNPPEEESVLFHKLLYLGCMKVSAPRNETEAHRAMASLKAQCPAPITVTLYVPNVPDGSVRIIDENKKVEITSFPIYKVLFCARGNDGTSESDCIAFTERDLDTDEFQIHVFSCEIKEAIYGSRGTDVY
uniref:PID domain-containing protein n=1 Tax=Leptobrachium leishanense TaxID=445787 RepID=A0A8C5LIT2_9ANUR